MDKTLLDMLWVSIAACLVFFMQAGFAFLESGLTRSKNSINVAMKNLTDLGISTLVFWFTGFAWMFGTTLNGLIGNSHYMTGLDTGWLTVFFLFQVMFCSTSATIVSGAVAERMKFSSYLITTAILSGLIYPIAGHWAWGGALTGEKTGWLVQSGFVDFAGSTVVHSVGGWMSLAALLIIGPRTGRFLPGEKPRKINGSSIPTAIVGVMILWFGWFGFNGGSTLAMSGDVPGIIIRTSLAGAAGMIVTLLAGWAVYKIPDVEFVVNGALAGLVAITASCHSVDAPSAILIGAIGGLVMLGTQHILLKLKIDDAVGAVPVHLAAGIWGTLAVGLFSNTALLGTGLSRAEQILAQLKGIGAIGLWAFGISLIILLIINRIKPLRVPADHEHNGLNISEHGATTELIDLFQVMDEQSRTGRLDLRVPVEPFTEVGQIASRYNHMLGSLENHVVARSDYQSILDTVSDGLFLMDRSFRIAPSYSRSMTNIFKRENFSGESFKEILASLLPQEVMQKISDYLDILLFQKMSASTLQRLNPMDKLEIFLDGGDGRFSSKFLRINFQRITSHGEVSRLMGIVQDITEQVQLGQEVEKMKQNSQTEMEMFYKILHLEPQLFIEFLSAAEEELQRINTTLENHTNHMETMAAIARHIHTIKGDARLLELDFFAERAHQFESKIRELQQINLTDSRDYIPLAVALSGLFDLLAQMKGLLERVQQFQSSFVEINTQGDELIALSIKTLVENNSAAQGKKAVLDARQFRSDLIPKSIRRHVKDALVQLARNSVAHGLETPEERKLKGKPEQGLIELQSELRPGGLAIIYRDDGRGIDYDSIRQKARQNGRLSNEEAASASEKELISLIFEPGFSTAGTENLDAGRGIGMEIVRKTMDRLCARLTLKNTPGQACEFAFTIPIEGF